MSYKDLVIIENEKISKKNNIFYCDNFEAIISEDLNKHFDVTLIARQSKINRPRQFNLEKVRIASNIFSFIFSILKTFKKNKTIYLIISITPYTFFTYLFLFFFRKKVFIYLRSDGYEEYKAILGFIGPIIYNVMFKIVTLKSQIISCQERLFTKRESHIVFPSELNSLWLDNINKPNLDKPKLLYVGRIKVEKGIFSLTKILNEMNLDFEFSIVGDGAEQFNKKDIESKKNIFYPFQKETSSLIKLYDQNNIFILPSFTEAHPKVLDEALARARPVIIFEDIKHVVKDKKGIFVSKRNAKSFMETIHFIMKNYTNIQESMIKNKLPTKEEFISEINNILSSN